MHFTELLQRFTLSLALQLQRLARNHSYMMSAVHAVHVRDVEYVSCVHT
jgi:hypothetical protein